MSHFFQVCFALLCCFPSLVYSQQPQVLGADINVVIKKLDQLNSRYQETNMCITPDGNTMYFMSDRGGQPWSELSSWGDNARYDGDIWMSQKHGDTWSPPTVVRPPVNSANGEDEPNVLPDGHTVFFQSWQTGWDITGGPYYTSELNGTVWSNPKGLGGGLHRFFVEMAQRYDSYGTDGVAVSPDGNRFVVAAGADYFGNMDLYLSEKNAQGIWSWPRKLSISTSRNERSAFFAADGKTLYFSSNGHGGFGGLDIFKTTVNSDGTCGPIINLGPRFNTLKNDYGFIIAGHGEEAYFVRNGDIYQAIIKDPPPELLPQATGLIKGKVLNHDGSPMACSMRLVNSKGVALKVIKSSAVDGSYSFFIDDATQEFKVTCSSGEDQWGRKTARFGTDKLYSEVVVDFNRPAPAPPKEEVAVRPDPKPKKEPGIDKQEVRPEKEFKLPPEPEEPVVVHNKVMEYIYFSYNEPHISASGRFKLNTVARNMIEETNTQYLITSFGDHKEGWDQDGRVAYDRAVAVARYLIGAGVPEEKLVVEFYPRAFHENRGDQTLYAGIRKVEITRIKPGSIKSDGSHNLIDVSNEAVEVTGVRGAMDAQAVQKLHSISEAIQKEPGDYGNYVERALLHATHHDYDAALQDLDKARELHGPQASPKMPAHVNKSDHDAAIKRLNQVIKTNPKESTAMLVRGEIYSLLGKQAEACRDWNKARSIDPELMRNRPETICN